MLAMWTPGLILEVVVLFGVLSLILCGIVLIAVGGFYFVRVVSAYFGGRRIAVLQTRAAAALQAGNLALIAVVCGPLVAVVVGLASLPVLMRQPGFGLVAIILDLLLITVLGMLAGIIAGGAFWVSSALMGRVRKTAKKWTGRGVSDPDLDGFT